MISVPLRGQEGRPPSAKISASPAEREGGGGRRPGDGAADLGRAGLVDAPPSTPPVGWKEGAGDGAVPSAAGGGSGSASMVADPVPLRGGGQGSTGPAPTSVASESARPSAKRGGGDDPRAAEGCRGDVRRRRRDPCLRRSRREEGHRAGAGAAGPPRGRGAAGRGRARAGGRKPMGGCRVSIRGQGAERWEMRNNGGPRDDARSHLHCWKGSAGFEGQVFFKYPGVLLARVRPQMVMDQPLLTRPARPAPFGRGVGCGCSTAGRREHQCCP